jgi:hypothetical protein
MSYRWCGLLIFILLLCGCRDASGTLFGSSNENISGNELSQSQDISLSVSPADLLDDPDAYIGDHLQLTGDLSRQPLSKCNLKARDYPANWSLTAGEVEIPVASSSQELNQLATDVDDAVLAGRWLHWQGLVGCGRETSVKEQWYLDVDRLVSPNPIALVPVLSVSPHQDPQDSSLQPPLLGTGVPTGTSTSSALLGDDVQQTGVASPTPQQENTSQTASAATATAEESEAPTTPTPEQNQVPVTPTATTGQPSPQPQLSPTPTASPTVPTFTATVETTPEATATAETGQTIFRMALDISSIETGRLGEYEVHRWTHEITSTKQLTVSLASDYLLDLAVSIVDDGGHIIAQQNAASGDEPEILRDVTLLDPGIYDILVSSPTGEPGYYAILISDDESYPYIFQGTLAVGDIGNALIVRDSDHFWHFSGTAGQAITINVVPTDNSDLFLNLFGTDGVSLIRFHDETGAGEPEQIIGYVLPDTGIYSLRIGEFNFGTANYEIFLTDG